MFLVAATMTYTNILHQSQCIMHCMLLADDFISQFDATTSTCDCLSDSHTFQNGANILTPQTGSAKVHAGRCRRITKLSGPARVVR